MKRLLLLFACMLKVSWVLAQFNGSGTGTEDDPYIILNADQFYSIRNFQNDENVNFSVLTDIDLSDYAYGSGWEPIPNFKGVLNGNGHTIRGLKINRRSSDKVGLFANTYRAKIKNITVEGNVVGNNYVGGIAGKSESSISGYDKYEYENVFFKGTIEGNNNVGGIAGYDAPGLGYYEGSGYTIEYNKCGFSGSISGGDYVGGIVGYAASRISNCFVDATISANQYVGSICGRNSKSSSSSLIEDCYASVKITATDGFVGGVTGYGSISVMRCSVSGSIIAKGNNVGGVMGYAYANGSAYNNIYISDSYFMGYLKANEYVGGIIGYNAGNLYYSSSYKTYGYVTVQKNYVKAIIIGYDKVGGIVSGYQELNNLKVESNVCVCTSIESEKENVGRIQATAIAIPENCYSLYSTKVIIAGITISETDIESNTNLHGTDIAENNLKTATFYQGLSWDFGSTWSIINTECTPYLQTQAAPPIIQSSLKSGDTNISGNSFDGGTVKIIIKDLETYVSTTNNTWSINVPELQSGIRVVARATADDLFPSYDIEKYVAYLGAGTQDDPYLIKTCDDLKYIKDGGFYKLVNDIDMDNYLANESPTDGWKPIEVSSAINLDGDNHKIHNMFISGDDDFVGLFSSLTNATINDLTIEIASNKNVNGSNNVGILAGRLNNCTIENVSINGDVNGICNIGGLAGQINGGFLNNIDITTSNVVGKNNIGGIAGTSSANATLCSFNGNVTDNVETNDGITAGTTVYIGGLFAISDGDISQSIAEGTVTATRDGSRAGGLVGDNYSDISNCYSTITVGGDTYAAGIAANNHSMVYNCYASGNISTSNESAQTISCGLIGYNDGANAIISNSSAINQYITSSSDVGNVFRVIGGIKNEAVIPGQTNYVMQNMILSKNGIRLSQSDDPFNGYMKPDEMFKTQSLYENNGWDFEEIWYMNSETGYPDLLWNKSRDAQTISLASIPSMTYGDDAYTLPVSTDQGLTLSWTVDNTNVASISGNTLTINGAGNTTITAIQAGNEEYAEFSMTYTLTVAKAPLTITADNKSKMVGTENPELTVTYDGFVNGDDASSLTALPSTATTATVDSPVGTYPITASGAESSNYDITYIEGTLTISEEPLVIDDTDISLLDNVVYIEPVTAYAGNTMALSIKMKNTVGIQTVQFDLYLPEGVEVLKDEDDYELIELSTERTTARKMDQFSAIYTSNGAYRVLINSTRGDTFDGTDGEIVTAQIKLSDDIEGGDYPIIFRDIVLVDTNSEGFETDFVKSTLSVPDYLPGDVNNDGKVNAIDLNAITNYILEHRTFPFTFNTKAADINTDTKINAIDLNAVTNMILHSSTPSGIKRRYLEAD